MEILTTVIFGLGTVFFGLVCLIVLIELLHFVVSKSTKKQPIVQTVQPPEIEEIDHKTLVVMIASAVAEELGKDVSAIRIKSIKKI